jgi:serine/threonine protein phosphatase PrpC
MKYQITQYSLRGARPKNEDRVSYVERDNAVIMAVADGLGGHLGGEIAAEILVQTLMRDFRMVRQPVIEHPSTFLALGILHAHHAIISHGQASQPPIDPRTTCVVCLVQNGYAYWAHVGDSRLYHFRRGRLILRTQDHTTVEELHQGGLLSETEMLEHPQKSHLLDCLGGPHKPTISVGEETALQPGDMLLLCTDGLWEAFAPDEILQYLRTPALDAGMEEMLYAAVRKRGEGCDNVSAVCLRWEDAVTRSASVQGKAAARVDEDMLRNEARRHLPHIAKLPPKKSVPSIEDEAGDENKSIKSRIQEIEDFLKKFESK